MAISYLDHPALKTVLASLTLTHVARQVQYNRPRFFCTNLELQVRLALTQLAVYKILLVLLFFILHIVFLPSRENLHISVGNT